MVRPSWQSLEVHPLRGESEVLEFILGWGSLSPERSETPLEIDSANGSPTRLLPFG